MSEQQSSCAAHETKTGTTVIDGVEYHSIPGFSRYLAREDGTLYSLIRLGRRHALSPLRSVPKLLRGSVDRKGYIVHDMIDDSDCRVATRAHRLILLTFSGPSPEGTEACHSNGVPSDNRACNLRWGTAAENTADKYRHGTVVCGSSVGSSRLIETQVAEIKERLAKGEGCKSLARAFGVGATTIVDIRRCHRWKQIRPELNARLKSYSRFAFPGINFSEECRKRGISRKAVMQRMSKGMSLELALNTPPAKYGRRPKA